MIPAVLPPKGLTGRTVDFKLKPGWWYDEARGVFANEDGKSFAPRALPRDARIVYKVPDLVRASPQALSDAEKDLRRYLQVILPTARGTKALVKVVQSWPAIEEAHLAPQVSLPTAAAAQRMPGKWRARRNSNS
jgi:hypothetical protein